MRAIVNGSRPAGVFSGAGRTRPISLKRRSMWAMSELLLLVPRAKEGVAAAGAVDAGDRRVGPAWPDLTRAPPGDLPNSTRLGDTALAHDVPTRGDVGRGRRGAKIGQQPARRRLEPCGAGVQARNQHGALQR